MNRVTHWARVEVERCWFVKNWLGLEIDMAGDARLVSGSHEEDSFTVSRAL
jgi:hypothetical protein